MNNNDLHESLNEKSCVKEHVKFIPFSMHSPLTIVNTLRPSLNGRHFPYDIFKCIFVNENVWISIKIALTFVPKGPSNNIPALVQMTYLNQWLLFYWRL